MSPAFGLPTVRTLDHVGVSVADLETVVRFFVDVLGFDELYRHAPRGADGEVQVRQFARHPGTEVVGIAMLRLGTLNLELLQFRAPDQRQRPPRTSDWGGTHLALYVDDLDAAVAHLRANGARVLGAPMALPGPESGPGNRFIFVLAPGEIALELVSYPHGKQYEQVTGRRLFDPRQHERWRHDA